MPELIERYAFAERDPALGAASLAPMLPSAVVGTFPAVRLAFAWAKTDAVSASLGQVNFFMEFDVCFYRFRSAFEVRPKQLPGVRA